MSNLDNSTKGELLGLNLSVFTSDHANLSKGFKKDDSGKVVSFGGGIMYCGNYERGSVDGLQDFDELLDKLTTQQATAYGISDEQTALVKKKSVADAVEGAISRSRDHFYWPAVETGYGILMIDYDPEHGEPPLSAAELYAKVCEVMPELDAVAMLWRPSASSCIWDKDTGKEVRGINGQRLYFAVDDASMIPKITDILFKRLWLAGLGHIFISRAGSMLVRTIIDGVVSQPERLDFSAGAYCIPPLERRPVASHIFPGEDVFRPADLVELTPVEENEYISQVIQAKIASKSDAELVKAVYVERRTEEMAGQGASDGAKSIARETILRGIYGEVLYADFPLQLGDGSVITVGDLLTDRDKYHGVDIKDPLEPEYRGGGVCARCYLKGKAIIHSFAHGGTRYRLEAAAVDPKGGDDDDAVVIARLAAMPELDYQRVRKDEAKKLGGVKVGVLDKLVAAKRNDAAQTDVANDVVEVLEPWPRPVNGDDLLKQMVKIINKHTVLPPDSDVALSLWLLASYCMGVWSLFPKVLISSPDKRCGKSTLLEILEVFAHRALMASNISSSAVFRCIELFTPTLILDEADTFMKNNPEMNGILNAGHKKRMAFTVRNEAVDGNYIPTRFNVWCPQIIAGIGRQQGTLHDRSICIDMKRKTDKETVDKVPSDGYEQGINFRRKCMRWAADNHAALINPQVKVPACGNDRTQDNWQPLYAVAEVVGRKWLKKAKKAYFALNIAANNAPISLGEELLTDVRTVFSEQTAEHMFSTNLVKELVTLEGRPWADMGNEVPLNQNKLAKLLKAYDCQTRDVRINGTVKKGYTASELDDAFRRYLKT